MKHLINKVFYAILILLSITILGISVPIMVSLLLTLLTPASFEQCTTSVPFWLITIIGWFISAFYVNDLITEN